ncbi:MAG: hypothetical protein OEY79_03555 [Anaplasmataceae bacterium]|nr:hypothetical protein [Anaplasmataceae bacterium]
MQFKNTGHNFIDDISEQIIILDNALQDIEFNIFGPKNGYIFNKINVETATKFLSMKHSILTNKLLIENVKKVTRNARDLHKMAKFNINYLEKKFISHENIDFILIADYHRLSYHCYNELLAARKSKDSSKVKEIFHILVAKAREIAKIKSQNLRCSPYDTFLNSIDPDLSTNVIDGICVDIGSFLKNKYKDLSTNTKDKTESYNQKKILSSFKDIEGIIDKDKYVLHKIINLFKVKYFNFSETDCLNFSLSTTGNSLYVDNISNFKASLSIDNSFMDNLQMVLSSLARCKYNSCLPRKYWKSFSGAHAGMSVVYGNDFLFSKLLFTLPSFISSIIEDFKDIFNIKKRTFNAENLIDLLKYNFLNPSLLMSKSDQITGMIHKMIRYNIERDLINGTLEINDLEDVWNEDMKHYFDLDVKDPFDGYLQNDEWFQGKFGHFSAYITGEVFAVQLFQFLKSQNIDDINKISSFMCDNVYSHGMKYRTHNLLENITGSKFDTQLYKDYISDILLNDKV